MCSSLYCNLVQRCEGRHRRHPYWGSRWSCWSMTGGLWDVTYQPRDPETVLSRAQKDGVVCHRSTADFSETSATAEGVTSTNSSMLDLVTMSNACTILKNVRVQMRIASTSVNHYLTCCGGNVGRVHWTSANRSTVSADRMLGVAARSFTAGFHRWVAILYLSAWVSGVDDLPSAKLLDGSCWFRFRSQTPGPPIWCVLILSIEFTFQALTNLNGKTTRDENQFYSRIYNFVCIANGNSCLIMIWAYDWSPRTIDNWRSVNALFCAWQEIGIKFKQTILSNNDLIW